MSIQTALARAAVRHLEEVWAIHKETCPKCCHRRERCSTGAGIWSELADARADLRESLEADKAPAEGQLTLFCGRKAAMTYRGGLDVDNAPIAICDGCGASTWLPLGDTPRGWRYTEGGDMLCNRCIREGCNDTAGSKVAQVRSGLDLPDQSQTNTVREANDPD